MEALSQVVWRTSTLSSAGNCVETAFLSDRVAVRDSKDRQGPVLLFTHSEWDAFLGGVRLGEFELPSGSPAPPATDSLSSLGP